MLGHPSPIPKEHMAAAEVDAQKELSSVPKRNWRWANHFCLKSKRGPFLWFSAELAARKQGPSDFSVGTPCMLWIEGHVAAEEVYGGLKCPLFR